MDSKTIYLTLDIATYRTLEKRAMNYISVHEYIRDILRRSARRRIAKAESVNVAESKFLNLFSTRRRKR